LREEQVTFQSDGLKLSGVIGIPDDVKEGEKRPAFIVLHGFGSRKTAGNVLGPCKMLDSLGYVTMRFDMRGCGESEGERGFILCLDQVSDTRNALTHLATHKNVDPTKIALLGSSFGAAVSLYTGGIDKRVAAVVSSGGWGNGTTKFQGQHKTPEEWKKFTAMLEEGKRYKEKTGKSMMVPRYDIVPIPEHLRGHVLAGSIMEFPHDTAQSMMDFRANDVIKGLSPRPLLLLHSSDDSVTPTEQSIELFKHAGQPADLHLFAETDHFMFAEGNTRVRTVLYDWLANFFPVKGEAIRKPVH
jgi:dipeptidyl aminopeptidase/acylaminoacyl peptidase